MRPWYKNVELRDEVREGRSFDPSEFAIALEQVVAGTAPPDYNDPVKFFDRTCFTTALKEHVGLAIRRLAGETRNTAPVMALLTQFGGGKTHTLTTIYHMIRNATEAGKHQGVRAFLQENGLKSIPDARVAVFVGNAWDPSEKSPTPWIDMAWQLAGKEGVEALGPEAKTKAPGTDNLRKLFDVAGGRAIVLCDEVLNYLSRHRDHAEGFKDFLQNLVRAMTGCSGCAAMLSLPQSKPEMDDYELRWQDIIVKEVGRVARQLIANDEAEISEVVRRRLFDDLGSERVRTIVAGKYADWCFERRAQLPPEWTAVDTATTEKKARQYLHNVFESCYPFHPSTLSVFQRKWQALPHYQQTRGTLAMLAQWISHAYIEDHRQSRDEPLITLGSAPMGRSDFRAVLLGQLGEPRLDVAVKTDIAGDNSHARALDADTKGPLRDIHSRVGTTILFESSGGQTEKVAHLPEIRFALGEPDVDTTTVDNAALALQSKAYYIRKVGSDGFQIHQTPTIKKMVNDRKASLDEGEVRKTTSKIIEDEFKSGAGIPLAFYPQESDEIPDSPRLRLVIADSGTEWDGSAKLRKTFLDWTLHRDKSDRLYPASIIWCVRKPGRELQEKVEEWLAWRRIQAEQKAGTLGADLDRSDREDIDVNVKDAQEQALDEVWASYRYVVLADKDRDDGLRVIDLGAGHASGAETLCGRVIAALKSEGLLNESVGAGFIDRNWPPAFEESGAWPLSSLRQSFLDGSLTRLLDPDTVLKGKIAEFVQNGELGLASGKEDGQYQRIWFSEFVSLDDVVFESDVYLLKKEKAEELKSEKEPQAGPGPEPEQEPEPEVPVSSTAGETPETGETEKGKRPVKISGSIPPELWNRLGTKVIPKLRDGEGLEVNVSFSVSMNADSATSVERELRQIIEDLGITDNLKIE